MQMRIDDIRARLAGQETFLRSKGIKALAVFGSVARGQAGPDSDVDLLYDLDPAHPFGFVELIELRDALSAALGARVDLANRARLHRRIRDSVLAEAVPILT